jgi:dissimilatory sulfite reductase (desulfoviridin) alpha/beta subunit
MANENIDYDALKMRGFLKQKQENFFVVRARMASGIYDKEGLEKLGDIAKRYGRGIVHATTRQGLEIPFIRFEDIDEVEKELSSVGLLTGTSGPRLRTTTVCPGNNWCKSGLIDTFSLEEKLDKAGIRCALELPHKFKIAISGCPNGCTRPQFSDIGIHGQVDLAAPDKHIGYAVYIGGSGGKNLRTGFKLDKIFTKEEVLQLTAMVVEFYKRKGKPRQRLGALIEEIGKDNFFKEVMI